jgi:hypothetical protein
VPPQALRLVGHGVGLLRRADTLHEVRKEVGEEGEGEAMNHDDDAAGCLCVLVGALLLITWRSCCLQEEINAHLERITKIEAQVQDAKIETEVKP